MASEISSLKNIKRITLNEKVYIELKNSIIAGDLKPDTKLNEIHIAKKLGVSATPVREAFKRLSSEGFVTIVPYVGAMVKSYELEEIVNAYICRESLELLMVELAMPNVTDKIVDKLYRLLEVSKRAKTIDEFVNANSDIHLLLMECTRNNVLERLLESLREIIYHDRNMSAADENRRQEIMNEHSELIDALAERDMERAKNAMSIHIQNGLKYIKTHVK